MKELKGIDENTLPEKWAVKTDRQEFYDWLNEHRNSWDTLAGKEYLRVMFVHVPHATTTSGTWSGAHGIQEGYELITFERWANVHRPDLVTRDSNTYPDPTRVTEAELNDEPETPAIPEPEYDNCVCNCSLDYENCVRNCGHGKEPEVENKNTVDEMPFPAIPEKWCVKRTSENAEVLNAWAKAKIPYVGEVYEFIFWTGESHVNFDWYGTIPEITFEQWQTIPEHAEWLKTYKKMDETREEAEHMDKFLAGGFEKVEEREIIGYVFKEGNEYLKPALFSLIECFEKINTFEEIKGLTFQVRSKLHEYVEVAGIMHWFEPVYREKPVFKVGEYATVKQGNHDEFKTFKVLSVDEDSCQLSNGYYYSVLDIRNATPEEIEAARPREIWEKYPTWESLPEVPGFSIKYPLPDAKQGDNNYNCFATEAHAIASLSFAMLSQLEKAWNEGKKCTNVWHEAPEDPYYFTVKCKRDGTLYVSECYSKEQINFNTKELAIKSLELHGDLWRKYWMV